MWRTRRSRWWSISSRPLEDAASTSLWPPPGRARHLFIAILILAAALRAAALDKPFYVDEISTLTIASQPFSRMSEAMREIDASPILYPLLLHGWIAIGRADAWVRSLSAIFGLMAVVACAAVAARAFGWRAGLGAAFVVAIAPAHVHYAQYVRSYSLFTLLAAVHVWLFLAWLDDREPPGRWRAVSAGLLTAALLYTHYLALLLFAAEGLAAVVRIRDVPRRVLTWVAIGAAGGLLFLPGLPLLLHNAAFDKIRNADRPSPPPLYKLAPDLASELMVGQRALGFSDPAVRRATLSAAAIVFPALWAIGLVRALRTRRDLAIALLIVSLVPIAIYVGSGRKLVAVRFFLPFAVGYLAFIGYGLAVLRGWVRWTALAMLAVVSAVPLWHFYNAFSWSYDHRRVAQDIVDRSRAGDVIFVTHPYEAFHYRWYIGSRLPIRGLGFTPIDEQETYEIKPSAVPLERAQSRVQQAAGEYRRLWLVGQTRRSFASDAAEERRVIDWLDRTYTLADDLGHLTGGDPAIRLYDLHPPAGSEPRR